MFRGHERDAGIDQSLLGIEHVEYGALADGCLTARAEQRNLRSRHQALRGYDLRLARQQLTPCRDKIGAGLIANLLENEALLLQRFLRLPYQRIFRAALIDRHAHLGDRRSTELPDLRDGLLPG